VGLWSFPSKGAKQQAMAEGGQLAALLPLDQTAKMKGLPFKAVADDVIRFFGQVPLKPEGIFLKRHPDGRPSGEVRQRLWVDGATLSQPGLVLQSFCHRWLLSNCSSILLQAFVRFESSNDQKAALQKDRETFGLEKWVSAATPASLASATSPTMQQHLPAQVWRPLCACLPSSGGRPP
jgi:hypothetical protein